MQDTILKIEHVSKFYPGVIALNDVSFELKQGEVRALCGENGAGKSTLIKCIMGVEQLSEGSITMNYDGRWVVNANAVEAQSHGVFANYQSVTIAPDLSIAENYFLGCQPTRNGLVDWRKMTEESQRIIDKFEMNV
ncbi:MAG: ATP-binding cassette domain-containing protein, partial [Eubacteriales bacterium]|nr:ATP-binding cassette domain-containing protein [Eubacteriales bacterium]